MRQIPSPQQRNTRLSSELQERKLHHAPIERVIGAEPVRIALVEGADAGAPEPLTPGWPALAIKRGIDAVGALVLLLVLSPVFVAVAAAIRLDSPGPAFFAHRRLGRGGRLFDCLKFRTMHCDAEDRLHQDESLRHKYVTNHFKIPSSCDPRITRLGRFLRQSSIDELPQLFNVLKGEMSLVGPRPIVPLEATHYGENIEELLSVRPGITGAWAVEGRSDIGYPERSTRELNYVRGWNLLTDIKILLRTPLTVVTRDGAV